MWRLEVLGQSWDLRLVPQFHLVIVGRNRVFLWLYYWYFLQLLEDRMLGTSEDFFRDSFQEEFPEKRLRIWLFESCLHCWVPGTIFTGYIDKCLQNRRWTVAELLSWIVTFGSACVESDGDWLFGKANRNLTTIEAPWKQDGLSPSAKVLLIALANSWRSRGASHQPTFMCSCLTTSHTCLSCLPSRWVRPCFLCLHMIGLTGVLLLFFSHGESGVSSMGGSPCFTEWVWNSQIKLYCCFRKVKFQQGFTPGIWY